MISYTVHSDKLDKTLKDGFLTHDAISYQEVPNDRFGLRIGTTGSVLYAILKLFQTKIDASSE